MSTHPRLTTGQTLRPPGSGVCYKACPPCAPLRNMRHRVLCHDKHALFVVLHRHTTRSNQTISAMSPTPRPLDKAGHYSPSPPPGAPHSPGHHRMDQCRFDSSKIFLPRTRLNTLTRQTSRCKHRQLGNYVHCREKVLSVRQYNPCLHKTGRYSLYVFVWFHLRKKHHNFPSYSTARGFHPLDICGSCRSDSPFLPLDMVYPHGRVHYTICSCGDAHRHM